MTRAIAVVRTLVAIAISLVATLASLVVVALLIRLPSPPHEAPPPRRPPIEITVPPPTDPRPTTSEIVDTATTHPREASRSEPSLAPVPAPSRLEPLSSSFAAVGTLALPALGAGPALEASLPGLSRAPEEGPDVPARPLVRPAPTYPPAARLAAIEGRVVLVLRIDERGRVSDVHVKHAQPPGVFDEVARATVQRYRFEPARRGGQAIATTVEQDLVFRLRR